MSVGGLALNKKDVKATMERISELTRSWESNRVKIMQLQQETERLLQVDQSLLGGISELKRLLRIQAPKEKPQEEPQEDPEKEHQDG